MLKAIMVGAGQRGYEVYGVYAKEHPADLPFVAVAEPQPARRKRLAEEHEINESRQYEDWHELLSQPKMADCAFICTQDRMHTEPTLATLKVGYHVVLEKPMAPTAAECIEMGSYAQKYDRLLNICHVLRYSDFFSKIKAIVQHGTLGEIVNIKHAENVSYWHQAHSFVRGNWNNSETTTPMVLQKTCHDMDILLWLIDKKCTKVSSFGSLSYFTKKNMPAGAPLRCTDPCPHKDTCIYNAERFYLGKNISWPVSVISEDISLPARKKALETGPYGRCIYQCDNNVVDHQITNLEFDGGSVASLTMSAFNPHCTRFIEVMGTKGYLIAEMNKFSENARSNEIKISDFLTGKTEIVYTQDYGLMTGHEGADVSMTNSFLQQIQKKEINGLTSASRSIESHLMALAADRSRIDGRVVLMDEVWDLAPKI